MSLKERKRAQQALAQQLVETQDLLIEHIKSQSIADHSTAGLAPSPVPPAAAPAAPLASLATAGGEAMEGALLKELAMWKQRAEQACPPPRLLLLLPAPASTLGSCEGL